ncbi:DUF3137 domain-containing protein [Georgenia alba]|uniref:DUF3137 domain-containing protein n=1 Tax=Georgenia alba TaxID=2233858 RepID=A0ABW2Q1W2_9MICO
MPSAASTVVFAVVAVVLALLALGYRRSQQRLAALRAWARAHDWQYSAAEPGLNQVLRGGPFGRGHDRRFTEVVRGRYEGRLGSSWRYSYTVGSGKYSRTYHEHVVALVLSVPLPYLELTNEGFVKGRDLQLESAEFNDVWNVEGEDPKTTSDVLHPRMMERLLQPDARAGNLLVEDGLILWWRSGVPDAATIDRTLRLLDELIALVPGFVWDDVRRGGV